METFDDLKLGESVEAVDITTSEENRAAALALARQAHMDIEIVSRYLDPPIYDNEPFIAAIKQLALSHRRAKVRILVSDSVPIVKGAHRLLALAGRLSTFIELRILNPQHKNFNQALMLVDETGYIFRELSDRYEGLVSFNDHAQTRYFTREFEKMWEIAVLDPDLRQMKI